MSKEQNADQTGIRFRVRARVRFRVGDRISSYGWVWFRAEFVSVFRFRLSSE